MDQKSVYKIVLEFLEKTVHNQGTIKIQNLTGHFSQLPADIRKRFSCTKAEVKKFLLEYPEVFVVNDDAVSISPNKYVFKLADGLAKGENLALINDKDVFCDGDDDDDDDEDDDDDDDDNGGNDDNEAAEKSINLINCKGKIYRKFDVYGFIEYCSPTSKTTVYFDVFSFEDGQNETFNKVKLDEEVNFHAKPSIGHKADYRATKVWRCGHPMSLQGSEKCYSSSTSLASQDSYQSDAVNGAGEVMKITPNYGFIKPVGNVQGNVFFFRTKLQLPDVREVKNLEDVIAKGDILYFSAIQSRKKNADAPWEATKVSRTLIENAWNGLSKHSNKGGMVRAGSTSTIDSFTSSGLGTDKIIDENHIYDQVGNIQKLASNEPIITFGQNEEVAYVPPNVVYKNNRLMEELGWELDEDTVVHFNAEWVNNSWKATLVWIGEKPVLATSKKSHKKKNTQMKESTVSDLCEISLYDDDQSDNGIWHTSYHVDTNSWDEENSENWPALEPPVSSKNKPEEKINLLKVKKISKRVNTVTNMNEERHSNESGSDGGKEINGMHNSKRSHKKERQFDACSYSMAAAASSKYCQQSQTDSFSDIERYKKNNGWEESSFNTNSENWPALNEPVVPAPISTVPKGSHKEGLNRYQNLAQEQIPNKVDHSDFVHPINDMQENYYSDDELSMHEIAPDIAYPKDLTVMSPHSLDSVSQKVQYDKFSDVTGMVTSVQKYFAFIKYGEASQNLIFSWEQAFCNGLLVSQHYTCLNEAYYELDSVHFTYCHMTDGNGKEWTTVLQVWKGEKPECIKQNEVDAQVNSSKTTKTIPIPKDSSTEMLHKTIAVPNKDYGVSMEETALWHKGNETETEIKSYISSTTNEDLSAIELKRATGSSQNKVATCDAGSNFIKAVLGLEHTTKLESPCCKELAPHTLPDNRCISSRNQETQTEVMLEEEGTQTFITGTVLSVAVFPQ